MYEKHLGYSILMLLLWMFLFNVRDSNEGDSKSPKCQDLKNLSCNTMIKSIFRINALLTVIKSALIHNI